MTRLSRERYLRLLEEEGERLLAASDGAARAPVPGCPDWTVDDLVFHVGSVYAHKLAALRLGRQPGEGDWEVPGEDATADEDLRWCHAMLHALVAELGRRPVDEPAWTWWPADQSVGFWLRRMALETAVHRADAESASGPVTPVDADLALDGIDEVLSVMLPDAGTGEATGMDVTDARVTVRIGDVRVGGAPSDVLLWLWGRLPDQTMTLEGDDGAVQSMRTLLAEATQ